MASERDLISRAAERQLPEAAKPLRPVPEGSDLSRDEKAAKAEKYGVAPGFRVKPATHAAIRIAAGQHDVKIGGLADFLLRAGLELLARGHIELPLTDGKKDVVLPPIPDKYQK